MPGFRTARALALVSLALLGLFAPCAARAQQEEAPVWSGAEGAGQALHGLLALCDPALADGFGFAEAPVSLGVALVQPGAISAIEFPAAAGVEYTVYAAGDEACTDTVTVRVLDPTGSELGEHPDGDTSRVTFSRPESGSAWIGVTPPYADEAPPAYCAIAVLERGGRTATREEFAQAFGQLVHAAGAMEKDRGEPLAPHQGDLFALFGAVLPAGESGRVTGMALEGNTHLLLCAGDERAGGVTCAVEAIAPGSSATSGAPRPVATATHTSEDLTLAALAAQGGGERRVLLWLLLDGAANG